ncbi:MAG: molecular chaperone TorD family protein [Acidobacteria bacterium]|nr:molecular chaperone TorD family protein [Acidobacteriota bacterium]
MSVPTNTRTRSEQEDRSQESEVRIKACASEPSCARPSDVLLSTLAQDEALCRSAIYSALSLGLSRPSPERLDSLRSEEARVALSEAARFLAAAVAQPLGCRVETRLDTGAETSLGAARKSACATEELPASTSDWIRTLSALTLDGWLSSHARLFGHTARGQVCPYEAEYGQEGLFAQPRQLARIMGFYRAFGLETAEVERERADHVSCELEFLDFLCRKEAIALEANDPELLVETQKAMRLFLKDHLGRFGPAFARLLRECDAGGFFGALGDVLFDFLGLECRRLGIPPGLALLPLRPAEEETVPMACGDQSELVQLNVPR